MRKIVTTLMISFIIPYNIKALTFTTQESKKYNYIFASGKIVHGDYYRLQKAYYSLANRAKQTIVVFNSSGGELNEGLNIGWFLKRHKIGTAVMPNGICASSCALAFLGGRDKYGRKFYILPNDAKLGYHKFYYKNKNYVTKSQYKSDYANLMQYFKSVHAPKYLIHKMMHTKSYQMFWVKRDSHILPFRKTTLFHQKNYYASKYENKKYSAFNYIASYFYKVNMAIKYANSFYQKAIAFNDRKYEYWLAKHLDFVYLKGLKRVSSSKIKAKVLYQLKNGKRACAINTYYLGNNGIDWYIRKKKITPCSHRSYKKLAPYLYRLP